MKKRILTFGVLLALVTISVVPGVVSAIDGGTMVVGDVVEGYTFTAPSPISLGVMTPSGTPYKGSSTDGSLIGNNPDGYTVTGRDETLSGQMYGGSYLANRLDISNEDANYVPADTEKTFVDTSDPTDTAVSLYVSQLVAYTDAPGIYTITITFTVMPKTP
jgi:hypothetical protein